MDESIDLMAMVGTSGSHTTDVLSVGECHAGNNMQLAKQCARSMMHNQNPLAQHRQ